MQLDMTQTIIAEDVDQIIQDVGIETFRPLEGSRVLITGPCGLIASYLVETIVRLNETHFSSPCEVIGISRSTIEHGRLGHLVNDPHIQFWIGDASKEFINAGERPFDFLIHAAGRSAPQVFTHDPIGTIQVNINGLQWILEHAQLHHSKSVLYVSSSEIYGNPPSQWIPTQETYAGMTSSLGLRSCYTESKRCAEALCMAYIRMHALPINIVRPALVYGPGVPLTDHRVLFEFLRRALSGYPIALQDSGEARRAYCYVTDAVTMMWKILLSEHYGEVFNVGNQREEISIVDLARLIHTVCEVAIPPAIPSSSTQRDDLLDAPNRVCLDMTKMTLDFGFEAKVSLHDGLQRTVAWYRERHS